MWWLYFSVVCLGWEVFIWWLFHILSKCIRPLPLAGGVHWCIYWQRLHLLHLGGLHNLACTCVCLPLPLCTHSVCLCKGCCGCCSRQWLQGPHPRSVPRIGIGVIQSFNYLFLFCALLFLNFLHLVCKAVSPAQPRAAELWAGIPCTAGSQPHGQADRKSRAASTHTHGHSNCSSQLITLQPACLSCFLFH